jgi:hypothetical protein
MYDFFQIFCKLLVHVHDICRVSIIRMIEVM